MISVSGGSGHSPYRPVPIFQPLAPKEADARQSCRRNAARNPPSVLGPAMALGGNRRRHGDRRADPDHGHRQADPQGRGAATPAAARHAAPVQGPAGCDADDACRAGSLGRPDHGDRRDHRRRHPFDPRADALCGPGGARAGRCGPGGPPGPAAAPHQDQRFRRRPLGPLLGARGVPERAGAAGRGAAQRRPPAANL